MPDCTIDQQRCSGVSKPVEATQKLSQTLKESSTQLHGKLGNGYQANA
jgi:hypothetical protein